MLLSATTPRPPLSNSNSHAFNLHFCTNISSLHSLRPYIPNHRRLLPFFLFTQASSSLTNPNRHMLHHVSNHDEPEGPMVSSASAVASTIRRASTSPVEFLQRTEKDHKSRLVLPIPYFQRLCIEQLDLFRRILDPDAQLSLSMLEPGACEDGLSDAHDLIHYFPSPEEAYSLPPGSGIKSWEIKSVKDEPMRMYRFSAEQRANAINIGEEMGRKNAGRKWGEREKKIDW